MSRSPLPGCTVDGPHLEALASVLLERVALGDGDPPHLVRLRAEAGDLDAGELEIGVVALHEVAHPLDGLLGLVAPDDWAAVGILAVGRAAHLDDPTPSPFRVASTSLVARTGHWAAAWQPLLPGTGSTGSTCGDGASDGELPWGRLDDALRRVLGLPTAPPPVTTHRLWATQWLDAVVEAVAARAGGRRSTTAADVVGLHPAVTAFGLDPARLSVAELVAGGAKLAEWRDWPQLRRACAAGFWDHPCISPDTAGWLDDGAFARLALGGWPELADLRDALGVLLAPAAITVVDEALAAWQLIPSETA